MAQNSKKKNSAKSNSSNRKSAGNKRKKTGAATDSRLKRDILIMVLFAFCILLFLSNIGLGGAAGKLFSSLFFGLFGLVEYIFPILLFVLVVFILANRGNKLLPKKIIGGVGLFVFICAFMQLLMVGYLKNVNVFDFFVDSAEDHMGGGLLGGCIIQLIGMAFGTVGAYVIVFAAIVIFAIIMTQRPLVSNASEKTKAVYRHSKERRSDEKRSEEKNPDENSSEEKNSAEKSLEENKKGRRQRPVKRSVVSPNLELNSARKLSSIVNDDPDDLDYLDHIGKSSDPEPDLVIHGVKELFADEAELEDTKEADLEETPPDIRLEEDAPSPKKNPRQSEKEIQEGISGIQKEIQHNKAKSAKYQPPSMSFLRKGEKGRGGESGNTVKETAAKLKEVLHTFGVNVTITDVSCGPSVTRYELQPEMGVKVSRIVNLSDDIKLNLAAADIRIEAPIPGKAAIGIEVPNKNTVPVMLRDIIDTDVFKKHKSNLAFAVGKDIAGQPVVADIAKMPHLLIAGATGSGKSVCINTLVLSIIYHASPKDVKLIMIDPKVVELSVYNGIPHLYIPVVTDPKKAAGALNWAVAEMTDRYNKFAEFGVRDVAGYNQRIDHLTVPEEEKPQKMPQIVIVVDELADLMMVAPGEVEDAICRLAQLARAAGIHLIIATQRPSVNVITGLIKANMPSRIALSVASGVDSRTIIDMNGAEKLLGHGDMLFYPQGYTKPARVQGAYVSDDEIADIVAFLKEKAGEATYDAEVAEKIAATSQSSSGAGKAGANDQDELFVDAAKFVVEKDKASIGLLQRRFKIGFNRAARIMEQLNEAGVVSDEEGTKPRKVLMSMEQLENNLEEGSL